MDQCKCSAEGRTFQRLPPFERGEIKALSGEGPGAPAIAARIGHFAETGGAAHGKSRKPLKIAERPDFMAFAGEKPGEGRPPDAARRAKPELSGKPALWAKAPCKCIDPGVMPIKNIDLALKVRRKLKSEKARQSGRALGRASKIGLKRRGRARSSAIGESARPLGRNRTSPQFRR